MNDYTTLVARQNLADMLGRLLLAPPSPALWEEAAALAHLAAVTDDRPEALAVAYEYVFGRNVYPYESLYRDEELMLNTATAEQVAVTYNACGFLPTQNVGAPDHLGLEFIFLARLIATEATALANGNPDHYQWARQQMAGFLIDHLAAWVPVWARAVQRIPAHPFYQTLARLTVEFIGSELERLSPSVPTLPAYIPLQSATAPADVDELGALVRHLITPVRAGFFLSRADCTILARQLGFSVPISDRFTMVRTLFEAAGQFEQVLDLVTALANIMSNEIQELHRLIATQSAWQPLLQPWLQRLTQSIHIVRTGLESQQPG